MLCFSFAFIFSFCKFAKLYWTGGGGDDNYWYFGCLLFSARLPLPLQMTSCGILLTFLCIFCQDVSHIAAVSLNHVGGVLTEPLALLIRLISVKLHCCL